ncbi:hypothetical protein E5161_06160 [Cohnella pontilimi]|uniref:Uncharacterized protein n=1 Tax=Cohnella pontilimi TaxID=2564100 RepID=A0A4U0FJ27_9BACL|nr:hypothetical protein [Cohnella pontilimi]TJY43462.1 hypothetical protein E5161_06160 [Cohnella pontilimi]
MDTHTIQARFATQEEAESAVRKLSSLRGDRFRLERESGGYTRMAASEMASEPAPGAMNASEPAGAPVQNFSGTLANEFASDVGTAPAAAFTLSADVPASVTEQARRVIQDAGGELK